MVVHKVGVDTVYIFALIASLIMVMSNWDKQRCVSIIWVTLE